jgi:transcriptional regulator with XRE-family HTH domain
LSNRIDAVLKEKGISKAELARLMNVKPQQVTRWSQASSLQWQVIQKICAALQVSPSYFLGIENDATDSTD